MKPTYNMEIANRLAEIRRQQGLSQEELAARLGLSRQAVSKWERAESQPDMGNLIALADVYGMTIDEIVCRSTGGADGPDAVVVDEAVVEAPTVSGQDEPEPAAPGSFAYEPNAVEGSAAYVAEAAVADAAADEAAYPPPAGNPVDPFDGTYDPYGDPTQPPFVEVPPAPAKKRPNPLMAFPYPVAVVVIYLVLGFAFGLWHPGWILFLTIPFYYWAAAVVGNDPNYVESQSGFGRSRQP